MYIIGLDEAGYGPTLGPLCHGLSIFHLKRERKRLPDLWVLLAPVVSKFPAAPDAVCIDDSKKIYASPDDLSVLFQTVRHFTGSAAHECCAEKLLRQLMLEEAHQDILEDHWGAHCHEGTTFELPPMIALQNVMEERGIRVLGLNTNACSARSFNRWLDERQGTRNKAELSWHCASILLKRALNIVLEHAADATETIYIQVDRQGGRKFYSGPLSELLEGAMIEPLEESPGRSAYRGEYRGCEIRVEFLVDGESRALPIALAAISAKFTREVLMRRFNAYFTREIPALKPTAGYPLDAGRFLDDIAPYLQAQKIKASDLVRSR